MTVNIYDEELSGNTRAYPPTPIYKRLYISTDGFQAPGTKPAALVEVGIGHAWEFTDGTDDTLFAKIRLPSDLDYNESIYIGIGWSTPTADAGNCRWQVEYLFRAIGEAINAAADDTLVNNFAASTTAHGLVQSNIGIVTAGASDVLLLMRIKRRADELGDTLGEDNHLHGIAIRYTSTTRGTTS